MSKLLPVLIASFVLSGAGLANAAIEESRGTRAVAASESKIVVAQVRAVIRHEKPLPPNPCRLRCSIR